MAIRHPQGGHLLAAGMVAVIAATVATATPAAAAQAHETKYRTGHFVVEVGSDAHTPQVSLL